MTKANKIGPMDQWVVLNRILKAYKTMGVLLVLLSLILMTLVFYLATSPPIVVMERGSQYSFYYGERRRVPITEEVLLNFLKEFVRLRYTWKERDSELILKNIAPFTTEGLLRKIRHALKAEDSKGIPESMEQVAVNIHPTITEKKAKVTFDRIIRMDGVPMLAPMELDFSLIKGKGTRWNPKGIYINGITQKELK